MTKRALYIVIGIIAVVIIATTVVLFLVSNSNNTKEKSISITNLESCSKNMQVTLQESMQFNLYRTIKGANDYNKKASLPQYSATLREGTCTEHDIAGVDGVEKIKESTAIVDIPEAKQSWFITYHWMPDGRPIQSDLGTIVIPTCLKEDKLIYGTFNCEQYISLITYGTNNVDPILPYVPYQGAGFHIEYEPTSKTVTATIELQESQKNNQKLINNLKVQVEYWFTKRSLDITSYNLVYKNEVEVREPVDYAH